MLTQMLRCTLSIASIPNACAHMHKSLTLIIGELRTCPWELNAATSWLPVLAEKLKVRLTATFTASKGGMLATTTA